MDWKLEINNLLRSNDITGIEVDQTVFVLASIGLAIGKDKLGDLIYGEGYNNFKLKAKTIAEEIGIEEEIIVNQAISILSDKLSNRTRTEVYNILLKQDLYDIVFNMPVFNEFGYGIAYDDLSSINSTNQLVMEIAKKYEGSRILNIDCGIGDFIFDCAKNDMFEEITGCTGDMWRYIASSIRKKFLYNPKIDIEFKNTFSSSPSISQKYDIVYNTYPPMMSYKEIRDSELNIWKWDFGLDVKRKYSINALLTLNSLNYVNNNGIIISFIPDGFLFNHVDMDIREYLIKNKYIETIINLPDGIIPSSSASSSLVIINKNKKNNVVKMINAKDIFHRLRRNVFLSEDDIEKIVSLYNNDYNNTELVINVPYENIIEKDYDFGMNRYLTIGKDEMINPHTLESVTNSIFRGTQIKASELEEMTTTNVKDTEYRIINVSDITLEGTIESDLQAIIVKDKRKFNRYCVEDGDIIITAKNTNVKTAVYREQDYKAIISGNLIAIRPDKKKINPYYLKAFFDSEAGQTTIKSVQTGTIISSINPSSLKTINIPLLSTQEQDNIANEYKDTLYQLEKLLNQTKNKMNDLKNIWDNKFN